MQNGEVLSKEKLICGDKKETEKEELYVDDKQIGSEKNVQMNE